MRLRRLLCILSISAASAFGQALHKLVIIPDAGGTSGEIDYRPSAVGRKILYYDSTGGAVYETNIQSAVRRESIDFNTSKFSWGFYTSSGATWNEGMALTFNVNGTGILSLTDNTLATVMSLTGGSLSTSSHTLLVDTALQPNVNNTYDLGGTNRWRNLKAYSLYLSYSGSDSVQITSSTGGESQFIAANTVNSTIRPVSFGATSVLSMQSAGGTSSSPTAITSGSVFGSLQGTGYDGTAYQNCGKVDFVAAENWAHTPSVLSATDWVVQLCAPSSGGRAERLRVKGDGSVVWPANLGRKMLLYDSGSGFVYGSEIQSGTRRESKDVAASTFEIGYYSSSGTVWNSEVSITTAGGTAQLSTDALVGTNSGNVLFSKSHFKPFTDNAYDLGDPTTPARWRTLYTNNITFYTTMTAPSGSTGASTTCTGGNVLTNQVVSGGITTSGTCAAAGGGDMYLALAQTVTGTKTFSGAEVAFAAATGEKILYYNSGSGAVYSTYIASGARREAVDFNTSYFDVGYWTSSGTVFNQTIRIGQTLNNAGGSLDGLLTRAIGERLSNDGIQVDALNLRGWCNTCVDFGTSSNYWNNGYIQIMHIGASLYPPSGNPGIDLTCGAGNTVRQPVYSKGVLTSGTCAP